MSTVTVNMNGVVKNGYKTGAGHRFEEIQTAADFLRKRTQYEPDLGIICGSGLGGLASLLTDTDTIDYRDIPHFPISTVPGHAGKLVFGKLGGKTLVCMKGRVHAYEGYSMWKVTFPIRVMREMGVKTLLVTNACGGLNSGYSVGDLMIIKDHINLPGLAGMNPLVGMYDERLGPLFPPMSDAYDKDLCKQAWSVAEELNQDFLKEGVYVYQIGPMFETVAECKMLRHIGADVVGMSTVPEVTVAKHVGLRVFGMSLVTNMCVMDYENEATANHEEVLETGHMRAKDMERFFSKFIERL